MSYIMFDLDLTAAELSASDWVESSGSSFTFDGARELDAANVRTDRSAHILLAKKLTNGQQSENSKNGWIERQGNGWFAQIEAREFLFERITQAYFSKFDKPLTLLISTEGEQFPDHESIGVNGVSVIFNRSRP